MSDSKPFDPQDAARHGYRREDWDAVDSPELSDQEIAGLRPMSEAHPDLYDALSASEGNDTGSNSETTISLRLDADLAAKLRSFGPGWESRVREVLRRWADEAA